MVVFDPLKVVITNYSRESSVVNREEMVQSENNPKIESAGTREIPFSQ
jgi:hypothetical protein